MRVITWLSGGVDERTSSAAQRWENACFADGMAVHVDRRSLETKRLVPVNGPRLHCGGEQIVTGV